MFGVMSMSVENGRHRHNAMQIKRSSCTTTAQTDSTSSYPILFTKANELFSFPSQRFRASASKRAAALKKIKGFAMNGATKIIIHLRKMWNKSRKPHELCDGEKMDFSGNGNEKQADCAQKQRKTTIGWTSILNYSCCLTSSMKCVRNYGFWDHALLRCRQIESRCSAITSNQRQIFKCSWTTQPHDIFHFPCWQLWW